MCSAFDEKDSCSHQQFPLFPVNSMRLIVELHFFISHVAKLAELQQSLTN